MAKKKRKQAADGEVETVDFRHSTEKRKNIPPAKIAAEGTVPRVPKAKYQYSPHLPPVLRSDPTGSADRLPELVAAAGKRVLTAEEQRMFADALRNHEPWLEWTTKREQHDRGLFEVDPVALHIHERVSAQAIVRVALREDVQRDLFADPQQPYQEAVQFYRHDMDWANRLILGDSLQVMSSLARRENLAGKVQMIYVDPPYGIRFSSNFQPEVGRKDVKEKDVDLTREPEMVRAYRDTWNLGVHSYLSYMRCRLIAAHHLLAESGSIFVQIGDANLHRVRVLLDEIFGPENYCSTISYRTSVPLTSAGLASVNDYILWYARHRGRQKYFDLFVPRETGEKSRYSSVELPDASRRGLTAAERNDLSTLPPGTRLYSLMDLASSGYTASCIFDFEYNGRVYRTSSGKSWKTTPAGMARLAEAGRISDSGKTIRYVLYLDDFPVMKLTNSWQDTTGELDKQYVVQTHTKVIERCMLMTTSPGDLVMDPTVGSGTTAVVAEQWGRRWIGIDTSRVAISIARQRLITSRFEHYRTRGRTARGERNDNPCNGFVYRTSPHVTLRSIAQNENLDPIFERFRTESDSALAKCNAALQDVTPQTRRLLLGKLADLEKRDRRQGERLRPTLQLPSESFEPWTVPFEVDEDWPKCLRDAVEGYRKTSRTRTEEIAKCIAENAEQDELVDQPEVVRGVVRVSGPFTVEGVRPEELALADDGPFDPTPNEFERDDGDDPTLHNISAYLTRMVQLLRQDGIMFLNNKQQRFGRIEPLFEQSTGTVLHAEGAWESADNPSANSVAIGFGPQFGPVTALQVEELVRASRRYDELVVAGFSFDAEASAAIQEAQHPKLRIHQAYVRPDVNPGMDGLLKDTPDSQFFTVVAQIGAGDLEVRKAKGGEFQVHLHGVDVYDPVSNVVRSTGADKVAAWFLDGDFDGRCFCVTQAFFPDKRAWEKIAKALKTAGDAFQNFSGTISVPFPAGKHRRIAVKVIDPRGNEVMAIRALPV